MTTTDYVKQAQELLDSMGVSFSAELIGSACPRFCEDAAKSKDMGGVNTYPRKTHIHGKQYRVTFTRVTGPKVIESRVAPQRLTVDFWNSYSDEEYNAWRFGGQHGTLAGAGAFRDYPYWDKYNKDRMGKRRVPTPYDVLACLAKSDPGSFEDFARDYGYDSDSKRAEEVYRAVVDEWRKVRAFFTEAEIERLQEVA